jgi:uncharacterized protein YcgI (DUF1989 family)
MPLELVEEIFIPAGHAVSFRVDRGQIFRLLQVEEKQVADAVFLNAHDYKETFHAGHSAYLNCIEGIGNLKRLAKLYSGPARENVMLTVVDDPVGIHFAYIGNRCSRMIYQLRDKVAAPPHRSCQDNLAEALAPYGLGPDDVPEVFNIWMNVDIDPTTNRFVVKSPTVGPDDYLDLRAEMDVLVAVSSCPSDIAAVNDYRIKPLRARIFRETTAAP